MQRLRRYFITGFFVIVPLLISLYALVKIFEIVDGLTTPLYDQLLHRRVPGLGTLTTVVVIILTGAFATNVIGRRILQRTEGWLLHVPLFRTIYAPVKELVAAFSPDNESGFKQVVMFEDRKGMSFGFVTKEFTVDRGQGPESFLAVYVPTNHLYMGDVVICERSRATFPDITVEEAIRIFLSGGTALPAHIRGRRGDGRARDFRV